MYYRLEREREREREREMDRDGERFLKIVRFTMAKRYKFPGTKKSLRYRSVIYRLHSKSMDNMIIMK